MIKEECVSVTSGEMDGGSVRHVARIDHIEVVSVTDEAMRMSRISRGPALATTNMLRWVYGDIIDRLGEIERVLTRESLIAVDLASLQEVMKFRNELREIVKGGKEGND